MGEPVMVVGSISVILFLMALLINAALIACVVIAVVSLVRIASGVGRLENRLDDIKRELEKQNKTE